MSYSGYGPTDFPLIEVPEAFARQHPELNRLRWDEIDGTRVLLAPFSRTMAINGRVRPRREPGAAGAAEVRPSRSASPACARRHLRGVGALQLLDLARGAIPTRRSSSSPASTRFTISAYPISRAEGQARFARDPEFQITTKGADHPFHIHVNPFWVTRIEVPDDQGRLHNVLDAPLWMDTVSIPRGGRVVFRSRFADYTGMWVNHCHILMHEDHGMMQAVRGPGAGRRGELPAAHPRGVARGCRRPTSTRSIRRRRST